MSSPPRSRKTCEDNMSGLDPKVTKYLAMVADHARDGILLLNSEAEIVWANRAFEQMSGYSLREAKGQTPEQFSYGPQTDRSTKTKLRARMKEGKSFRCELLAYRKSGETYWIDLQVDPIQDADGQITHYVAIRRDITTERATAARKDELIDLVETCPLEILVFDGHTLRFKHINAAARKSLGYSQEEFTRMTPADLTPDLDLGDFRKLLAPLATQNVTTVTLETTHLRKDGSSYPCEIKYSCHTSGNNINFIAFSSDVSQKKSFIDRLKSSEERYELAINGSNDGIWDWWIEENKIEFSDRNRSLLGYSREEYPDNLEAWSSRLHEEDRPHIDEAIAHHLTTGEPYSTTYRIRAADGGWRWWRSRGQAIWNDAGEPERMIGTNSDVTSLIEAQKNAEQAAAELERRNQELEAAKTAIEHNALHDSLTGLPNRRYLEREVERIAAATTEDDAGVDVALLHVDLDRFKQINDTRGHAAGDEVLRHTAEVLTSLLRESDFAARIGGDEFVVLCRDGANKSAVCEIGERLVTALGRPLIIEGRPARFGASVGVAFSSRRELSLSDLLVNADLALYRAKEDGRNRVELFSPELQAEQRQTKQTADAILYGLENDEFFPVFQPQFDADTHAVVGLEALARWRRSAQETLPPAAFLDVAEELNVVGQIDRLILGKSLTAMRQLTEFGIDAPKLSVNVSFRRLMDPELFQELDVLLANHAGRVAFELLESICFDDCDDEFQWRVDALRERGIEIEIDDFGSGRASITSLIRIQPQRLKIDRQLIIPMVRSARSRQLVEAIIEMGRVLDINVTAEGVETMGHAELLRTAGCQTLQGYAFSQPLPFNLLLSLLREPPQRQAG
ncbi:MAG: EAL domain-containing protein [Rhodobacteraceae bacterium]|nr:EAL domain-containing protein [Paracoccaceae bacterium]